MWNDGSLTIPQTIVTLMLKGEIPVEYIVALLAIMSNRYAAPEVIAEDTQIDLNLVLCVFHFLETGQIVTEDGEIVAELERSLDETIENPASVPSDSETIYELFKRVWPDHVGPNGDILTDLEGYDRDLVNDVVLDMEMSDKPIHTPPVLARYILQKTPAAVIKEKAEILRRTKAKSADTIIARTMRDAEQKLQTLPKLGATPNRLAQLQALKGQLGGRPQSSTG